MMNPKNPVDRATAAPLVKEALQGWRATAIAAAAAAALCWLPQSAHALSLGRINVLSALGEPLLAEIELPDITAAEAASLQASIAAPAAFRAAGLEYSSALQGIRINQQRLPNGRAVLRLTSERPATAPFVDLILQVTWASGRTVRDYTILLDPPTQRQVAPDATTAPQVSPSAPVAAPAAPSPQAPPVPAAPIAPPAASVSPPAPARVAAPTPPRPRAAAAAPVPASGSAERVTVRPGDTASRIAAANKPAQISLDQMLVAMLRSNPDAFIQGNVNRVKAGAVLNLPTPEQAASTAAPEASRMITAQSRDFNAFRGRLAGSAPPVRTDAAERSASGRVQTQVDEKRPGAAAPDRLTLSKGGVKAGAAEDRIAQDKAAAQADERVAELSRNIGDLTRLGVAVPASAPTVTAQASAPASAPVSAPVSTPASAPAAPTSAPVPAPPAQAAAPSDESAGWLNDLLANPLVPAAAAGLVALLAALGLYRARQRRKTTALDPAHTDYQQPDSFFGSSGGQRVDTAHAPLHESSLASYSPSQLNAFSDADPITEADVYLAYGRDLQAEEILRDALRSSPTRLDVHAKLAEIHAKRHDRAAFLAVATQVHALTDGVGPEWAQIAALGRELVPADPMWSTASPASAATVATVAAASLPVAALAATQAAPTPNEAPGVADAPAAPSVGAQLPPMDFDLDLDLGLDDAAPSTPSAGAETRVVAPVDLPAKATHASASADEAADANGLDFDLDLGPLDAPSSTAASAHDRIAVDADLDAPTFDLGSLNLDLGDDASSAAPLPPPSIEAGAQDPLATKLALAEEFHAIGDADGARALAEEVLAEASGPLKTQAQRFLVELG